MLNKELILKGPPSNYGTPKNWSLGHHIIDRQRKRNSTDPFCIDGITNEILTAGEFVRETIKLANLLKQLGIKKGDVVSVVAENSSKLVIIISAILCVGAVANPLNPGYSTGELKHAFTITKAKTVFCSKLAYKNVKLAKDELDSNNDQHSVRNLILMEQVTDDENGFDLLDALLESTNADDNLESDDLNASENTALLLLSSGTTGLPKGVMLTNQNCRIPAFYMCDPKYVGINPEDVTIVVLPFFHILGLGALFSSETVVILPAFQPELFLRCIKDHKASVLFAVPPIIGFLVKHPLVQKFDLSSIRMAICAGGSLGKEIQTAFNNLHPRIHILLIYGITETSGACTMITQNSSNKVGSVGSVIPDTEAMIWNEDLGENVGPLQHGELCFKGPIIMKGYSGRDTTEIDENGFYHTGDTGYYDEDGDFYIEGRIKELIKYKGFQVPPAELEDLLLKHPAVKDCGVIGIPDERAGQLPTALVVRQKDANVTEQDLINFVAERISVQKQLHGGVKFIDVIPINASGKILRRKLLELYESL